MQIKYVDDSHIELEEANLLIGFNFIDEQIELPEEVRKDPIANPGEYEYSDIVLMLLEDREVKQGKANLFKISMEQVQVLVLGANVIEIEKDLWEQLGEVDVLIIDAADENVDISKLINQINPTAVIALVGKRKIDVAKITGIDTAETNKKFKFANKDFQEEEPITQLYVLA